MRYLIKCFEHTDSDLMAAKLFVLTWNDCVVCRIPHSYTLLRRIAPSSVVCRSVCRSASLSHLSVWLEIVILKAQCTVYRHQNHYWCRGVVREAWPLPKSLIFNVVSRISKDCGLINEGHALFLNLKCWGFGLYAEGQALALGLLPD